MRPKSASTPKGDTAALAFPDSSGGYDLGSNVKPNNMPKTEPTSGFRTGCPCQPLLFRVWNPIPEHWVPCLLNQRKTHGTFERGWPSESTVPNFTERYLSLGDVVFPWSQCLINCLRGRGFLGQPAKSEAAYTGSRFWFKWAKQASKRASKQANKQTSKQPSNAQEGTSHIG